MTANHTYPVRVPALRVVQPLGVFYVTKLSAKLLLDVTYSDRLRATGQSGTGFLYPLLGSQREEKLNRLREIGRFIETVDAAFPNSIILGANYSQEGVLEESDERRWRIESNNQEDCFRIIIPSPARIVSIIDGQHRLHGFEHASEDRSSMELLCAVYLDLPNPYQAYLFATINFNQKKVDRSQAYELFGFNLDQEPAYSWSPEKAAVFLCRKLNTEETSPFYQRIKVAAQDDEILFGSNLREMDWKVSTATVVDGVLSLFSSNPGRDRDLMHIKTVEEGRNRSMLPDEKKVPLRKLFKETNDRAIYTAIKNFFIAVEHVFWPSASAKSYIRKTIGIQALFDILRLLLSQHLEQSKDIRVEFFEEQLGKARGIDFSSPEFQASGIGRSRIRNAIKEKLGLE